MQKTDRGRRFGGERGLLLPAPAPLAAPKIFADEFPGKSVCGGGDYAAAGTGEKSARTGQAFQRAATVKTGDV